MSIDYLRYITDGPLTGRTAEVQFPLSLYVRKRTNEDALAAARSVLDQVATEIALVEIGRSALAADDPEAVPAGVLFTQEPEGVFSVNLEVSYTLTFAEGLPFWEKMETVSRALDFFKRMHDRFHRDEEVELVNGRLR